MRTESEERIPTKRELIRTFGYDKFPNDKADDCCGGENHYLIDFITHRTQYHNQPYKETIRELEQFLEEIK